MFCLWSPSLSSNLKPSEIILSVIYFSFLSIYSFILFFILSQIFLSKKSACSELTCSPTIEGIPPLVIQIIDPLGSLCLTKNPFVDFMTSPVEICLMFWTCLSLEDFRVLWGKFTILSDCFFNYSSLSINEMPIHPNLHTGFYNTAKHNWFSLMRIASSTVIDSHDSPIWINTWHFEVNYPWLSIR